MCNIRSVILNFFLFSASIDLFYEGMCTNVGPPWLELPASGIGICPRLYSVWTCLELHLAMTPVRGCVIANETDVKTAYLMTCDFSL